MSVPSGAEVRSFHASFPAAVLQALLDGDDAEGCDARLMIVCELPA